MRTSKTNNKQDAASGEHEDLLQPREPDKNILVAVIVVAVVVSATPIVAWIVFYVLSLIIGLFV